MKDLSIYFEPVNEGLEIANELKLVVQCHDSSGFPEIQEKGIAIIYVPEYRNSAENHKDVIESFRAHFYSLYPGDNWNFSIYDLGTIKPGESTKDTSFALSQVVSELVKMEIIPFVIGGGQDLTIACYKGFESHEQMINICAIDAELDIGDPNKEVTSDGFISHLLMQRPCHLFNYTSIGMQRPLVAKKNINLFDELYFDICRLGQLNDDFKVAEPLIRNSDLLSIDFKGLKSADTDGSKYPNANGISASQICQIAKYAGMSDKMSCVGIFDIHPEQNNVASGLLAQIIWYFIEGVALRVGDFPIGSKKNYTQFHVHMDDFEEDLVFYKSNKSSRWWLEVRYNSEAGSKYDRHKMVPCDKEDYDNSLNNHVPDLWWKTLKKIN